MSLFSYGTPLSAYMRLSNNTIQTVFTAERKTVITHWICANRSGGAVTLTLEKTNGTTQIYYRFATSIAANSYDADTREIVLDPGWSLKATSGNASGNLDIDVTYLQPTPQGGSGGPA